MSKTCTGWKTLSLDFHEWWCFIFKIKRYKTHQFSWHYLWVGSLLIVQWLLHLSLKVKVKVAQSCLTLCDPMNYTVHEILLARILECVATPFSRDLPNTGIEPKSPAVQADSLPAEPQGKPILVEASKFSVTYVRGEKKWHHSAQ